MTAEIDPATTAASPPADPAGVALGRRRLLRGGLGATPVLMTLVSGPVGAAACIQASAFASLHASGKQPTIICSGRTPTQWFEANNGQWPAQLRPSNTAKFSDQFSPALTDADATLRQVLDPSGSFSPVARNLVAALLNTLTSPPLTPATILTTAMVRSIWTSFATTGFYEPTAAIRWDGTKIVEWISKTYA